jgi:hypothetical protein
MIFWAVKLLNTHFKIVSVDVVNLMQTNAATDEQNVEDQT